MTLVSDEINEIAVAGQQIFSEVLQRILNSEDPGTFIFNFLCHSEVRIFL